MAGQWVPAVNANPGVSAAHSSFPNTKCRCPPALGFLYLLSRAQRCAGASPPAPLQPATADVPRLSLAPEPRSLPPPAPGPAGSDPGTALACPRSPQRQTGPATLHAGAPKWHRVTDTLPHFPSLGWEKQARVLQVCGYRQQKTLRHARHASWVQPAAPGSRTDSQSMAARFGERGGKGREGRGWGGGSGGRWQAEEAAAGTCTRG